MSGGGTNRRFFFGCHQHEAAARSGRPLRASDPPLESEDARVHLRRAERDPHHRPGADRVAPRAGARLRARDGAARGQRPLRGHQEAGPGCARRGGGPLRPALRQHALAGRDAHQLHHDQASHPAPGSARGAPRGGRVRAADQEGSDQAHRGDQQARRGTGWHPQDAAPAGGGLHRRPPPRVDCGGRGATARDPDRGNDRHELRSRTSSTG